VVAVGLQEMVELKASEVLEKKSAHAVALAVGGRVIQTPPSIFH
jgi:hypothetical protein